MAEATPEWITEVEAHIASASLETPSYKPVSPTANYLERATYFRGLCMQEFSRLDIIDAKNPWALFYDGLDEEGATLSMNDDTVRMLIMHRIGKVPTIRMVAAELVYRNEATKRYMAYDFSLDYDDDAYYSVGMYEVVDDITLDNVPPTQVMDGLVIGGTVKGFVYSLTPTMGLKTLNLSLPTHIPDAGPSIAQPDVNILPFGAFASIADKTHALNVGRALLTRIQHQEPLARSSAA